MALDFENLEIQQDDFLSTAAYINRVLEPVNSKLTRRNDNSHLPLVCELADSQKSLQMKYVFYWRDYLYDYDIIKEFCKVMELLHTGGFLEDVQFVKYPQEECANSLCSTSIDNGDPKSIILPGVSQYRSYVYQRNKETGDETCNILCTDTEFGQIKVSLDDEYDIAQVCIDFSILESLIVFHYYIGNMLTNFGKDGASWQKFHLDIDLEYDMKHVFINNDLDSIKEFINWSRDPKNEQYTRNVKDEFKELTGAVISHYAASGKHVSINDKMISSLYGFYGTLDAWANAIYEMIEYFEEKHKIEC